LCNLQSGRVHSGGKMEPDVMRRSFFSDGV